MNNTMNKELVISAFNRNYDWVIRLNSDVKLSIYRKGDKIKPKEKHIEKNIGRDVHTFFYHIYENYDNLSDYTFFSQDFPFDHWGDIVETINGDSETFKKKSLVNFGGYYGYYNCNDFNFNCTVKKNELVKTDNFGFGYVLTCDGKGNPHHVQLNIDEFWDKIFDDERPKTYEFIPAGHFGITKYQVKKRSKDFYKLILDLLEKDVNAPWIIERLELYIFNPKFKSKI